MNTINSPKDVGSQLPRTKLSNPQAMRVIQTLSRVVTLVFLVALIWAIYQAAVNGNPLSLWAWLGIVVLFAVAIGLVVAVVVYRGVAAQAGPFDFRPSSHVTGELKRETSRIEAGGASSLRAEIKMTQGVLQLLGGAAGVMEAGFTYDDADWKPSSRQASAIPRCACPRTPASACNRRSGLAASSHTPDVGWRGLHQRALRPGRGNAGYHGRGRHG